MRTRRNASLRARHPVLTHASCRDGKLFDGGFVLRIFVPRLAAGYGFIDISMMILDALERAEARGQHTRLVVLPAGTAHIHDLDIDSEWWTGEAYIAARAKIAAWCDSFRHFLPRVHPPIVLGLDGLVRFKRDRCPGAIQVAVTIVAQRLSSITFKSKPEDAYEAEAIHISWDYAKDRPTDTALAEHNPIVTLANARALVLLCHDSVNWSPRSESATRRGTWAHSVRKQYDELFVAEGEPSFAVNLIHRLPREADGRSMTSPCFQSAHAVLRDRKHIPVIAVAGTHPRCSVSAYRVLHERLACDFASLDVLFTLRSPAK